jgi:hypothetical protein
LVETNKSVNALRLPTRRNARCPFAAVNDTLIKRRRRRRRRGEMSQRIIVRHAHTYIYIYK